MDPDRHVFEVAFICTGNRARSPFAAELFLRYAWDPPIVVRSFGTLDIRPSPVVPNARRAARPYGVNLTAHRSSVLASADLADVDLAFGFEPIHIAAAVVTGGIVKERAFLLTELTELLKRIPSHETAEASPSRLVELASAARLFGSKAPVPITDPVGRSEQEFATTFERIERHVAFIAESLGGLPPVGAPEPVSRQDP